MQTSVVNELSEEQPGWEHCTFCLYGGGRVRADGERNEPNFQGHLYTAVKATIHTAGVHDIVAEHSYEWLAM